MERQPFTQEELEKGHLLFSKTSTFMFSIVKSADLPPCDKPEICFAGRSNVGKSSLINAITGRKGLAKTSNTPGRTQCLNFFNISDQLHLVDMPGYGYAEAPKKLVKSWQGLIHEYLLGRPTLKRVFILIDSRHGVKENDEVFMNFLDECAVSYQIILTKGDKISKMALEKVRELTTKISQKHGAAHPFVHTTSAEKMLGVDDLRAEIALLR